MPSNAGLQNDRTIVERFPPTPRSIDDTGRTDMAKPQSPSSSLIDAAMPSAIADA